MVLHVGGVTQATNIYHFEALAWAAETTAVKLSWDLMATDVSITLNHEYLFLSSGLNIYRIPAGFTPDDKVSLIHSKAPASEQRITDISAFFVEGTDCKVSEW